jgi:hypothetical protein
VPRARAALAILLLTVGRARADDGGPVAFHGAVGLRGTFEDGTPSPVVRYDQGTQALTLDRYLRPDAPDRHGSLLASLGLTGRHLGGDLRWALTLDTGELRTERAHKTTQVCWSRRSSTGLAEPGSGECEFFPVKLKSGRVVGVRVVVPVEDTRLRDAELTSNGRPFADEAAGTAFVREAYATYRTGRAGFLSATVGRKRLRLADGYVYDDYATGAELRADVGAIGPPLEVAVAVFQPTRDLPGSWDEASPVVTVSLDYLPSLFERVGVFAAGLRERSGSLGNVFRDAIVERLVGAAGDTDQTGALRRSAAHWLSATLSARYQSESTLGWVGTSGVLSTWKGHRLAWTAAIEGGTVEEVTAGGGRDALVIAERVALRGQLVSVRYTLDLGPRVEGGASFLFLSGGTLPRSGLTADGELPPATGTYRGFVGIAPYLTETAIFFGGGLSESFADRQAKAAGVNGRGVLAPSLSLGWNPAEKVDLRARGAFLRAAAAGPFGGRTYGTEIDLEATWRLREWLRLGAEADALFPGDFFPSRRPITRFVLALDAETP